MWYRLTLVPLLGIVLLTLVAFAHASPPDGAWQPGIYDDADFDDVVDFIVSLSAVPADPVPGLAYRAPVVAAVVVVSEPPVRPPRLLLPKDPRSPPSS
jgi:hypothetical protein